MDNNQVPLVEEANAAAAECGADCRTSQLVASESDEPEITTPHGTSTESGNLEEPDPEVIRQAEGQLSLDIGDFLAPRRPIFLRKSKRCRKVTSLRTGVNILSRIHSSNSRKHSLEDAIVVLTMTGWTNISGCATAQC
eukprot:Em0001g1083a